jgi:hypothetical protein
MRAQTSGAVAYRNGEEERLWIHPGRWRSYGCDNLRCPANSRVYRATPDGLCYWNDPGRGNDVSFFGPDDRYTRRRSAQNNHWAKCLGRYRDKTRRFS